LSERESVRVFIDSQTNRILGMAPASVKAPAVPGIKFRSELLIHAYEIEAWLTKWRAQVKHEAEIRTQVQAERESSFRASIASQIRTRNQSLDPWNRDENNRLMAKMDADYARKQKIQMNPKLYGMAESSEAGKTGVEVALESPYYKHGPERVADGDRVDPTK
jgi:hypothetical protein